MQTTAFNNGLVPRFDMNVLKSFSFCAFLLILVGMGCEKTALEQSQHPTAIPVQLPDTFYMQLRGTTGKGDLAATFDVFREDSTIRGEYFLDSDGIRKDFWGEIWPNGRFYIQDNSKADRDSKNYIGHFTDENTLRGIVIDLDKFAIHDFSLKRTSEGALDLTIEYYQERKCERVPLLPGEYSEYASPGDTIERCSGAYIDKFHVSTGNPKVDKEINFTLAKSIFSQYTNSTSISEYLQTIHTYAGPGHISRHHRHDLGMNSFGIFSLRHWHSEENADLDNYHKMPELSYLNFDIQTGKLITLQDILLPGSEKELGLMLLPILKEAQRFLSFELKYLPGDQFLISTEGLYFNHFRYLSSSSMINSLDHEILLPYARIYHLLQPKWRRGNEK
jgi:hypothetical protein